MCRLFGQLSPRPRGAVEPLVDAEFSLLKQSDFNAKNRQQDGWGIGWAGPEGAEIVKSPRAAFKDAERFRAAAERAESTAVIGHIRAASNPRGIPRSRIINMANTQPFTDGEWIFAHNGTLEIPLEVAARLGPLKRRVKSNNDSEVYFWQFRKFHDMLGDGAAAFQACVRETWQIWNGLPESKRKKETPYTALNALATDGKRLYAFCHAARKGLAECGVCNPTQPWGTMSWREQDGTFFVASENVDSGRWTRFATPEAISAELVDGAVRVRRARFDYEPGKGLTNKTLAEAAAR